MIMIHPNLVNAWNVATATDIPMQSVFFGLWKIKMVGYQGHVIPIMISVWVMSNIEKRLHKVIPAMFDLFATPLISVFVTGYLALSAIGPVFVVVENAFLNAVQMLIAIPFGIGSFIMGALYAPTVVMGIHHMYTIIDLGQIAKYGVTYWLPLASAVNVAQGGACLAVAVKTKDPKIKSLCFPSSLSAFMGITEPAIFGVNLRFFKPFIAGCLGGAVGAMFASIIRLGATGTGVTGIFGILLTLSNPVGYILTFIISMAVAFAASWVLTPSSLIDANLPAEPVEENKDAQALGSVDEAEADKDLRVETKPVEEGPVDVASPLSGKIVSMEETKDETFIAGILGKGVCIIPDKDTVYAPDNGTVIALMGHAVGMKLDNGVELIVHVGVNTVELGGKHFEALVANGDKFKKGQALMKFDSKAISEAGYLMTTPVLVTNSFEYSDVTCTPLGDVAVGDKILTAIK
jgi:PTS system, glucose subfamily, IIA component